MSEKESTESNIGETAMVAEKEILSTEPANAVEKSQTNESDTSGLNLVVPEETTEQVNPDNTATVSVSCPMDSIETSEIQQKEEENTLNTTPENPPQTMSIEKDSEGSTTSKQPESHIEDTITADQIFNSNSESNEKSTENANSDLKMDTENNDNNPKQHKTQIQTPIGSLALLNQYASSSDDEEEDSSSDDDSQNADNESESDSADNSSNNQAIGTQATDKEKEISSVAHNILNSVMSRDNYREASSDSSESELDSDVECVSSIPPQIIDITNDEELQEFLETCDENAPSGPIKAKGEFGIEDLPPIAELTITVPESECVELGKISGIVDTLVLVESRAGFAAVDIDTVLFLEKGNRTLGQVFDVMGNVASPIYCVRFNNVQDIRIKNVSVGLTVYVAPQTEYTNFIVLSDLMQQKGCDASWENDHEAPEGCNEFSDDEEERLARRQHNQRQRNRNRVSESNERLPTKVMVKSEPNSNSNSNANHKRRNSKFNRGEQTHKQPTRFYKDNRGYANTSTGGPYHHQQMQPAHNNYSWHTASMQRTPSASGQSRPMPYPVQSPNFYPNPFAMQTNQINSGPFNLQAFPPLPPPMSQIPLHQQPPPNGQYNCKKPNSYQQQ